MDPLTTLTHVLPHQALSWLARQLAYSKHPRTRAWLIDTVVRRFGVDLATAHIPGVADPVLSDAACATSCG